MPLSSNFRPDPVPNYVCKKTFTNSNSLTNISYAVSCVAFSPDCVHLASGSADHSIKLWNCVKEECERTFVRHLSTVHTVAISPDGKSIASGSADRSICIWDSATGDCKRTIKDRSTVLCVAFSPCGTRLVNGTMDKTTKVWNLSNGFCERIFKGHMGRVNCVAYSPDGIRVVSGSGDAILKLWNTSTCFCEQIFIGHSNDVTCVAFSPTGNRLVSGAIGIRLWNTATGACLQTFDEKQRVFSVAFAADGKYVASGSTDTFVKLWNVESSKCEVALKGHLGNVVGVAFSRYGGYIVSGSEDRTIKYWKKTSGTTKRRKVREISSDEEDANKESIPPVPVVEEEEQQEPTPGMESSPFDVPPPRSPSDVNSSPPHAPEIEYTSSAALVRQLPPAFPLASEFIDACKKEDKDLIDSIGSEFNAILASFADQYANTAKTHVGQVFEFIYEFNVQCCSAIGNFNALESLLNSVQERLEQHGWKVSCRHVSTNLHGNTYITYRVTAL